ncbi:hypothetical protein C8E02_2130 [Vogesella indigofera]|uniref:Uncharacterized protein n=1 Tax=Vogesella indigofera TaxID=45465 RepID=A0A495BA35_VOGIN|nr:hypothetical protein C8E02_2130 [Vogesella indigofera]
MAHRLNIWPRALLGFKMPIAVFDEHLDAEIESRQAVMHLVLEIASNSAS